MKFILSFLNSEITQYHCNKTQLYLNNLTQQVVINFLTFSIQNSQLFQTFYSYFKVISNSKIWTNQHFQSLVFNGILSCDKLKLIKPFYQAFNALIKNKENQGKLDYQMSMVYFDIDLEQSKNFAVKSILNDFDFLKSLKQLSQCFLKQNKNSTALKILNHLERISSLKNENQIKFDKFKIHYLTSDLQSEKVKKLLADLSLEDWKVAVECAMLRVRREKKEDIHEWIK